VSKQENMHTIGSISPAGTTSTNYFCFVFVKTKGKSMFLGSGRFGAFYIVNNVKMIFLMIGKSYSIT